jgi:hypothetical protein
LVIVLSKQPNLTGGGPSWLPVRHYVYQLSLVNHS